MRKSPFAIGFVSGLPFSVVAGLISWKYHFFIIVWLVTISAQVCGGIYGAKYLHQENIRKDWLRILFWSNTFAWVFPPIGLFNAAATRVINSRNQAADRKLFMRLATIGFWLSLINAVILAKLFIHI